VTRVLVVLSLVLVACSSSESGSASSTNPPTVAITSGSESCQVTPEVIWLVEGQTARATVACDRGDPIVTLDDAPAGLDFEEGTLTWTPSLDQAGTYPLVLGPGIEWTVGVADAFADPDNVAVAAPETLTHEFGLQVLHLYSGEGLSTDYHDGTLVHGGRSSAVEVRLRGALSLQYPKPNLTVKVPDGFRSGDPAFDGLDRLVLVAGFDDTSLIRNRLAQQLWADIDDRHLTVPHANVVLYLDGYYAGLYTLLENVNDDYLARRGFDPAAQLFKAADARADFRLDDDPDPTVGFEKKSGEPVDGPAALGPVADLVDFVALADEARFRADLARWIDVPDAIDWFVFVSFISAGDSANKNAYWVQPARGGPFRYVPWDFNHSFGQDFGTARLAPEAQLPEEFTVRNGLFERLWADPARREEVVTRYRELLAGPLAPVALERTVDGLEAEIDASLQRNDQRWGEAYRTFRLWVDRTDFRDGPGEIAYIREWIERRHQAVTEALKG